MDNHQAFLLGGFRGFGGREFRIRFYDGRTDVVTRNLWHQGIIPEHYRALLPDNAEWVTE